MFLCKKHEKHNKNSTKARLKMNENDGKRRAAILAAIVIINLLIAFLA
jgi:hypothetical protein